MSAFIVSEGHICALIAACHHPRNLVQWRGESGTFRFRTTDGSTYCCLDPESQDAVGRMLLAENIRSVAYRYPRDVPGERPGPVPNPEPDLFQFRSPKRRPTPVEALRLLGCYEYQSCEREDWEQSEAWRFCRAAQEHLITTLPGYEDAAWEVFA